jgi:hypothetical protein
MTPLEKAKLIPATGENARTIEFMFNPTEVRFSRSISIEQAQGSRTQSGQNQTSFKHPNPYQLTISNIMLDTYERESEQRSVLEPLKPFTEAVAFATDGNGQAKRPPIYLFTWGENIYLRCFIKTCNFRLTMFLSDGTPVRAVVDLTLEQVDDSTPQPSQGTPNVTQAQRETQGRTILT